MSSVCKDLKKELVIPLDSINTSTSPNKYVFTTRNLFKFRCTPEQLAEIGPLNIAGKTQVNIVAINSVLHCDKYDVSIVVGWSNPSNPLGGGSGDSNPLMSNNLQQNKFRRILCKLKIPFVEKTIIQILNWNVALQSGKSNVINIPLIELLEKRVPVKEFFIGEGSTTLPLIPCPCDGPNGQSATGYQNGPSALFIRVSSCDTQKAIDILGEITF